MAEKTVRLNIKRQDNPNAEAYWEEFDLRWRPGMNVISALMDIAISPTDRNGKQTMPITYDSNCLEEVCGHALCGSMAGQQWRVLPSSTSWNTLFGSSPCHDSQLSAT